MHPERGDLPQGEAALRSALLQALADKAVLVQALQQLSRALAESRAEARQNAEALQRAMASARRLGRIGQLGLEMCAAPERRSPGSGEDSDSVDAT